MFKSSFYFLLSWPKRVLVLAWLKELNYRSDFWVNFIGRSLVSLIIPWFTWKAIFQARGESSINGMELPDLILYYALANGVFNLTQGSHQSAMASQEIYNGGLSKYLLYPLKFQNYALSNFLGVACAYLIQFLIILIGAGIFSTRYHHPNFPLISTLFMGMGHLLLSAIVYFYIMFLIECVAFWADRVWSLLVMLRFISSLLGGRLLPLSTLPLWAQDIISFTPFPYLTSFAVKIFMGETTAHEYFLNLGLLLIWGILFKLLGQFIFKQGLKGYTGVGI